MCVKTYDLESAGVEARPLSGRTTVVVPVQNGVDASETIGRRSNSARYSAARPTSTPIAKHPAWYATEAASVVFGELNGGRSDRTTRLLGLFTGWDRRGGARGYTTGYLGKVRCDLWRTA